MTHYRFTIHGGYSHPRGRAAGSAGGERGPEISPNGGLKQRLNGWLMVDLGYKILGVKNPMKFEDAQTNNKWESNSPNDSPNETDSESIPHVMGRSALNEGGRSAGSDDAQGHPGALPCQ